MSHNLFLAMYSFSIKKPFTSNLKTIDSNEFLSNAYPDVNTKFTEGFAHEIISMIDVKTFKNEKNTHGAILEESSFNTANRTLDLLINGGLTGIKQYIIDESGSKTVLSDKQTVGLKFFARIWLPANTHSGYIFIQKYGSLSIKPVFDSIIKNILKNHEYSLLGNRLIATTTKARQKEFLKYSTIRDLIIVSKNSNHSTGVADALHASIKLSNIKLKNKSTIEKEDIDLALENHGFTIANREYEIKATYQNTTEDYREEKTITLDTSEETINVIPNILIPRSCIANDNSPIFSKMQEFADSEIKQVRLESKC